MDFGLIRLNREFLAEKNTSWMSLCHELFVIFHLGTKKPNPIVLTTNQSKHKNAISTFDPV